MKLKDVNQINLLTVQGDDKKDQAQPEVFASFRQTENEIIANHEPKESGNTLIRVRLLIYK